MKKSLVSVLIPAYNHEKYVQDAIKSVINQTYENIELIVADDGSKDLTWQKIQQMQEECDRRFVRVHIETKQNEGTCKTMNRLLSLASGEFICFLASDDMLKPTVIEKEIAFLSKNSDYSLCVGNNEFIDKDGKICYWDKHKNIVNSPTEADFQTFADYFSKRVKINFSTSKFGTYKSLYKENYVPNGAMIRKSIFEKIGNFTQEAPLEDWWLMLQIAKYSKMKFLNEILFSYRWHSANTAQQNDKMKDLCNKTIIYETKILDKLDINNLPSFTKKDIIQIKNNGICLSSIGIPFIIELNKYKKGTQKIRKLKLFNFSVFEWQK